MQHHQSDPEGRPTEPDEKPTEAAMLVVLVLDDSEAPACEHQPTPKAELRIRLTIVIEPFLPAGRD